MGLHITVTIHQADDVVLDNIQNLNDDLMANSSFGELYDNMEMQYAKEPFAGPFRVQPDGTLEIANNSDSYFEGYDQYSQVWSCWDQTAAGIIAKHMTAGKLVFFEEIEGNPNVYWILTPGKVQQKSEADLRF